MSDFENMMNGYLEKVGGLVNLTIEERSEATQAGAETFKKELHDVTRSEHYNGKRKLGDMPHLADSIISGPLQGEKENGDTAVGFVTKGINHARIARYLNDGTVKMKASHFVDKTFIAQQEKTFKVMGDKIGAIQERKAK